MDIITIQNNEPLAGTYLIAKGFERKHKYIVELIEKHLSDFKDFGGLKRRKIKTKGRNTNEYLLNEDHAMFLGSLLRNSKLVIQFKKNLVKEFSLIRKQLAALKSHQSTIEYKEARNLSKVIRRETTDVMQQFVIYAGKQGSKHPERYYSNITSMANGLLFIVKTKFKNLRNIMTGSQLMTIATAEQIIEKALIEGMALSKPYKNIYQDVKEKVTLFAELHGQSEVINQALMEAKA